MPTTTESPAARVRHKAFTYRTALEWAGGRACLLGSADKPVLRVASPPEFKGEAGVWTPEDLLVGAANVCTMTTFVAFADRRGFRFESYVSEAEGVLEMAAGGFRFTRIVVRPRIVVADAAAAEVARAILDEAHAACIVANSLQAPVDVTAVIETAEGR